MSTYLALNHKAPRLAALAGAVLAAACGGDGGGEAPPPPPELLQITTQNQAAVARAAAMSFGTLDSFRDILAFSVPAGTQTSAAAGMTKHALGKGIVAVRSTGAIVRPQAVGSEIQPCPAGGSITVTFDDRDNSGTPSSGDSLTVAFNDCRDTSTSFVRGSLGVSLASYSASQITGQFTINQLTVGDETGSAAANGVASFDFASSTDASGALTERLNVTVGAAGLSGSVSTPKVQDAVTYDPGFRALFTDVWLPNQPGYDEAALYGKVTLTSIGGKVSLNTISPMHDSWVEDYPNSGKVVVDGYQSHLQLTPMNSTSVRLELDHNNDGVIEVTSEMTWKELLPF
jgi:hypothetical protein